MLYKPKFCCQCGEKIERTNWNLFTNRRFCDFCATEFGISDWLWRAAFGFLVVVSIIGIGNLWRKPEKEIIVSSNRLSADPSIQAKTQTAQTNPATNNNSSALNAQAAKEIGNQAKLNQPSQPVQNASVKLKPIEPIASTPAETVYFCGARTKKGTPCSRRVKTPGRCWQHAGQAPMLPPEKLIAGR